MNSETYDTLREIAVTAGAIGSCPDCHAEDIYLDDADANSRAYALATNAWKEEEAGLRGMKREEAMECMKGVLADATQRCQTCHQHERDKS